MFLDEEKVNFFSVRETDSAGTDVCWFTDKIKFVTSLSDRDKKITSLMSEELQVSALQNRKYTYSFSCWELDEKIDTTLTSVYLNMELQPGDG